MNLMMCLLLMTAHVNSQHSLVLRQRLQLAGESSCRPLTGDLAEALTVRAASPRLVVLSSTSSAQTMPHVVSLGCCCLVFAGHQIRRSFAQTVLVVVVLLLGLCK